jgi:putative peptide zinc metalloprotease protein
MSERNTFSPFWHRVRSMKPRLRPHVQVVRQRSRGTRWYVVTDPSSNAYFRLSSQAYGFVGLLDGARTVEEAWNHCLLSQGDESLTQNDVVNVLGQLHSGNLLQGDIPPETDQLLKRGRERIKKKIFQQAVGVMYFKVPLFNPNRWLESVEPIFRPVLNKGGLIAWCVLVVAALLSLLPHWADAVSGVSSAIAPSNWIFIMTSYVLLKLWHEFGHGIMCKRFGGQVPEFGAMMLVLLPSPFVDASSSWAFKNKWHRVAVGAGGMMFELAAAAVAAFIWIATKDDKGAVHQLAYNIMLTSGVSTLVFNANPLMRFDGYYMLSDAIEVPNLMTRSTNLLKFLFLKHVYRVENPVPPTSDAGEALILLVYGIAAMIYRVFIFISITLYVLGMMFGLGLVLAIWTGAMWFLLPAGSLIRWLGSSPQLHDKRAKAVAKTLAMAALVLIVVGAIPMKERRRADGVVESALRTGGFVTFEGVLQVAHVKPGARVKAGDPIVTIESLPLEAAQQLTEAQLGQARARETQAASQHPAAQQIAQQYVQALEETKSLVNTRLNERTLRAPHDGIVVGPDYSQRLGSSVKPGELLFEIVDDSQLRIAAVLPQDQADWVNVAANTSDAANASETRTSRPLRIESRRISDVDRVVELHPVRVPVAARKDLPHAALSFSGGGTIVTDAQAAQRVGEDRIAKSSVFNAYFAASNAADAASDSLGLPGERVKLRLTLPSRPLLAQWIDRIEKTLQGKAKV